MRSCRPWQLVCGKLCRIEPKQRTVRQLCATLPGPIRLRVGVILRGCWRSATAHDSGVSGRHATPMPDRRGYQGNCFQCPSEMTSTAPLTTEIAVWSSIAYAGPAILVAHRDALSSVLLGQSG